MSSIEEMIAKSVENGLSKMMESLKNAESNLFYSTQEVASILKVDPETVRRACRNGEMKYVKVGRLIRITGADFEKYCSTNTIA